jgi:EmrB/QacA subfamily drug resistance transporter
MPALFSEQSRRPTNGTATALAYPLPTGADRWCTFWITVIAVFMVSLDATVVVAAFPVFREAFLEASASQLSWVLNGYTIIYAALLMPAGRWADLHGRKRAFLLGLAVFTGASAVCGFSISPSMLIAARACQAVGAAMLTPATLALTLHAFPIERRAVAVGLWSAFGALAAALGPVAGSCLIETISWPAIFLINLPVGVVAWWLGRKHLTESMGSKGVARPDLPGSVLLMAGVGTICFGIVRSPEPRWSQATNWAALAAGLTMLAGFVAWARGRESSALDLSLFDDRNYRLANLATLVFGAAFGMMFLSFFLFMTGIWRYSQIRAGLAVTPGPLMVIPFAIAGGKLAARFGHRPLLVSGGLLYALGNLWYFLRVGSQPDYLGSWLPGQLTTGAAVGLVLPSLAGAALSGLAPARFGVGSAVNSAIRQLGSAIGVALTVAIVSRMSTGPHLPAFRFIYLILTASGVLTALIALPIDTRPRAAPSRG